MGTSNARTKVTRLKGFDERLKNKVERSTRLTYTVLCGGLEHLKIETRFIDTRFGSVMGE
jgi:hypothetical protein